MMIRNMLNANRKWTPLPSLEKAKKKVYAKYRTKKWQMKFHKMVESFVAVREFVQNLFILFGGIFCSGILQWLLESNMRTKRGNGYKKLLLLHNFISASVSKRINSVIPYFSSKPCAPFISSNNFCFVIFIWNIESCSVTIEMRTPKGTLQA